MRAYVSYAHWRNTRGDSLAFAVVAMVPRHCSQREPRAVPRLDHWIVHVRSLACHSCPVIVSATETGLGLS